MDTRLLYGAALVIVTMVGGFYYYSGKSHKLDANDRQNLNSFAKNIQVIQTNEQGQLYAKANIAQMTQAMQQGQAELSQIKGTLYENDQPNVTFSTDKLLAFNDYQDVELIGHVDVSQYNADQQLGLQFKTQSLTGNLKTQQILGREIVYITNPQGQFTSQGLKADLKTGQYDFFKIRGMYAPAK